MGFVLALAASWFVSCVPVPFCCGPSVLGSGSPPGSVRFLSSCPYTIARLVPIIVLRTNYITFSLSLYGTIKYLWSHILGENTTVQRNNPSHNPVCATILAQVRKLYPANWLFCKILFLFTINWILFSHKLSTDQFFRTGLTAGTG